MKTQDTLSSFVVRPASVSRQRRLNDRLLKMIVQNNRIYGRFRIRRFAGSVVQLITESTYRREWLPRIYGNAMDEVKAVIRNAEAVTLTTDDQCWTSMSTEGYNSSDCTHTASDTGVLVGMHQTLRAILLNICQQN